MSNDADVIRKMIDAWFAPHSANYAYTKDMTRVLAAVRAHDARPARRVPVHVSSHNGYTIIAACNDGTIHRGWWGAKGNFEWRDQLPPLPQPKNEQSQADTADAADALRFRWLAEHSIPYFDGFRLHFSHETLDIRAAIDASMKEKGDA